MTDELVPDLCPCGYADECAAHCNHSSELTDPCPPKKDPIEIPSLEDAQKWINRLNRWAIRDSQYIVDL